jgi:uncharacterized membrane protein
MIKLVGILVVAVGFGMRFNTLLVVMAAGIATGLAAGMPFHDIVEQFGRLFVENRFVMLPIALMMPVIGLLDRHGLKERAETLIRRSRAATAGRIILLYTAIRQIAISMGISIGSHAGAVRPLIAPMAEAAARARHGDLPPKTAELIRAHAAAADNVGNFFGEDIFIAVGAVLLMKSFFDSVHLDVSVWAMALWGLPTAIVAFLAMWWRVRVLDERVAQEVKAAAAKKQLEEVP